MRKTRRRYSSFEEVNPEADVDFLRERLAESFAEIEMLREEAALHSARAAELEHRMRGHDRRAGGAR